MSTTAVLVLATAAAVALIVRIVSKQRRRHESGPTGLTVSDSWLAEQRASRDER